MNTYVDTREQYRSRFQAAQAEVEDFQATGMLCSEAQHLLSKLPLIKEITDEKIRACVAIGSDYNHSLIAIANAVGTHAKSRDEVGAFCGLWDRNAEHAPYMSNIRKLVGSIWKRIAEAGNVKRQDLTRTLRWLYRQARIERGLLES